MNADESTDPEARIDFYTTLWSGFRERPFDTAELARLLVERGRHTLVAEDGEPDASLAWLVDAGVVTTDAGGYRVTAAPNDAAEALARATSAEVEAVRRDVLAALTATEDEESEMLLLDDGSYAVVELDAGEPIDAAADRVVEAAADGETHGIALTTPGTNADAAQRLADRLVSERPWSKAGSTVVEGDHEDAELVFRLYLDTA